MKMMTLFLTYELKVAVLIAVFYIFWRLLVANETWHRLNRIVLLSTAIASFVLPLCVITIHQTVLVEGGGWMVEGDYSEAGFSPSTFNLPPSTNVSETEQSFNWQLPLILIYIIGVVVVLSRMLLSLWRLHRMRAESEIHPLADGRQIAVCDKAKTPFSWWETVFMNHNDYEKGVPALLTHELGHLRLHHSADVLLVELLTALQWFNPAMWMLRADLRTIHEYEADQQVLSHGFNDIQYLQLLIRKAAGQGGYSLANGISNSALKKRVIMIMKPKSNHRQWLRYGYLLPIIAVSLAMSAKVRLVEVVRPGFSMAKDIEPITDENCLILLIDNLDDLKTVVAKKGLTRKIKSNLDFNEHFSKKSMNGKTIIVHLPKGSVYVNDKESKKIEADVNYAFPKGGFEWQLNSVPFDENNIPALHFKDLKKIENHWNGKKNVVNLITMGSQPQNEIVVVEKAPAKSEAADDKTFIAKGFVYDCDEDKSTPIVGAIILIDGTKKGTVTDREGKFQIEVSMGDKITASYVGYESKTIGVSKAYSESSETNEYYIGLQKEKEEGAVNPEKVYDVVEQMPQFPGGQVALYEFLTRSIQYPEEARKNGVQGRAIVTFVVEKDGSISNARVVKSVDPSLDAEALRVINSMPKWNPGKQNGEPKRVKYAVPVMFKLDASVPAERYVLEIDGKVADDSEIAKIPAGGIVSMDVVPAQNGQPKKIVITTKKKE